MSALRHFLKENGLSLTLAALFVIFILGQAISGWLHYNEENRVHGRAPVALASYLKTGSFGEAVFENWESEFLQMGLYVILTAVLFQKGSSESKDPYKSEPVDEDPRFRKDRPDAPWPVRKGGLILKLYNHSLSLALLFLFVFSFFGHAVTGWIAHNEEALEHGQPTSSLGQYAVSPQFWFESFQNWQSEFLAIFVIVVLSIWLRQKGSPESKPVAASHGETGK